MATTNAIKAGRAFVELFADDWACCTTRSRRTPSLLLRRLGRLEGSNQGQNPAQCHRGQGDIGGWAGVCWIRRYYTGAEYGGPEAKESDEDMKSAHSVSPVPSENPNRGCL